MFCINGGVASLALQHISDGDRYCVEHLCRDAGRRDLLSSSEMTKVTEILIIQQVLMRHRRVYSVWQFYFMGYASGCQYEKVRYSGWYNFVWNDPYQSSRPITFKICVCDKDICSMQSSAITGIVPMVELAEACEGPELDIPDLTELPFQNPIQHYFLCRPWLAQAEFGTFGSSGAFVATGFLCLA